MTVRPKVAVLSGGVGGAKLALGLYRILGSDHLSVVVNTGDDFDHLGLRICPDIDTTLYTLAGLANTELGWGRGDESWHCLATLEDLGGETWFKLGDRDLALHILRTQALAGGQPLSAFTRRIAERMGIRAAILPMSDNPVSTLVATDEGDLPFQDYFVRRQCQPAVTGLHFTGADDSRPAPGVLEILSDPALAAIVIAPSNPYLSIDPILAVPGIRQALTEAATPVIAITPVIGGSAVKGPTTKIMGELQVPPSARTIAEYYGDLIDGFLLDSRDQDLLDQISVTTMTADTLMKSLADRDRVARAVLAFAETLHP